MEIEGFDIHEVNRLIQREQVPGFKMLPKEKAYLEKYREALRSIYTSNKQEIAKNEITVKDTSATDEVKVEVKTTRTKKTSKRKATKKSKEVESE